MIDIHEANDQQAQRINQRFETIQDYFTTNADTLHYFGGWEYVIGLWMNHVERGLDFIEGCIDIHASLKKAADERPYLKKAFDRAAKEAEL